MMCLETPYVGLEATESRELNCKNWSINDFNMGNEPLLLLIELGIGTASLLGVSRKERVIRSNAMKEQMLKYSCDCEDFLISVFIFGSSMVY